MIVSATDRTNVLSSSFTQQLNQLLRKWNRSVSIILLLEKCLIAFHPFVFAFINPAQYLPIVSFLGLPSTFDSTASHSRYSILSLIKLDISWKFNVGLSDKRSARYFWLAPAYLGLYFSKNTFAIWSKWMEADSHREPILSLHISLNSSPQVSASLSALCSVGVNLKVFRHTFSSE